MPHTIIGIMGPGAGATEQDLETACELGREVARNGWTLLTGGRASGVMEAALRGAKEAGGLTVGVLPTATGRGMSQYVDIPVKTGMGSARNNINVLSSDLVIACGTGRGTFSEVMLALKAGRHVIAIGQSGTAAEFLRDMGGDRLTPVPSVKEAIQAVKSQL